LHLCINICPRSIPAGICAPNSWNRHVYRETASYRGERHAFRGQSLSQYKDTCTLQAAPSAAPPAVLHAQNNASPAELPAPPCFTASQPGILQLLLNCRRRRASQLHSPEYCNSCRPCFTATAQNLNTEYCNICRMLQSVVVSGAASWAAC